MEGKVVIVENNIRNDTRILREIIEQNYPLNEIAKEYKGVTSASGNQFCVWHKNTSSPAGKCYWDDEKNILVFHCFAEHKTYTSYDYVNLILCERRGEYDDPYDFLVKNMDAAELREYIKLAQDKMELLTESAFEKKIEYISNLYNEYDNTVDFINALYSA